MVLEDVTEWEITPEGKKVGAALFCTCRYLLIAGLRLL